MTMSIYSAVCKFGIVRKFITRTARREHLLADPNLYFICEKRTPNEKVFLRDEHLSNCRVLSSREDLLNYIPKRGIVAEVGVAEGYYSRIILDTLSPQKLYMIEYDHDYVELLRRRFSEEINQGVVEIMEGDSVKMLDKLKDDSLDFVFLDATHDYEHPKNELQICKDKVKDSGIIAGHDYTRFSMWESGQFGVIEAVNEFIIQNDYEMIYLTLDMLSSNSSYAIRKRGY